MNTLVIEKKDLNHNIEKIKEFASKSGTDDKRKSIKNNSSGKRKWIRIRTNRIHKIFN